MIQWLATESQEIPPVAHCTGRTTRFSDCKVRKVQVGLNSNGDMMLVSEPDRRPGRADRLSGDSSFCRGRVMDWRRHRIAPTCFAGSILPGLSQFTSNHVITQKHAGVPENLFIVRTLQPWHTNAVKRLTKSPKLHFPDSGLPVADERHFAGPPEP